MPVSRPSESTQRVAVTAMLLVGAPAAPTGCGSPGGTPPEDEVPESSAPATAGALECGTEPVTLKGHNETGFPLASELVEVALTTGCAIVSDACRLALEGHVPGGPRGLARGSPVAPGESRHAGHHPDRPPMRLRCDNGSERGGRASRQRTCRPSSLRTAPDSQARTSRSTDAGSSCADSVAAG